MLIRARGVGAGAIAYRINDAAFQPYTSPFVVAANGTTRITARATDRAGNVETALPSSQFMIDSTPPAVTITSPEARDYLHSDTLVVSFSAADALSGLESAVATLNGYTLYTSSIPLMGGPLGVHSVEVTATDVAGNVVIKTVPFRIVATVDSLIAMVNLYADEGRMARGRAGACSRSTMPTRRSSAVTLWLRQASCAISSTSARCRAGAASGRTRPCCSSRMLRTCSPGCRASAPSPFVAAARTVMRHLR